MQHIEKWASVSERWSRLWPTTPTVLCVLRRTAVRRGSTHIRPTRPASRTFSRYFEGLVWLATVCVLSWAPLSIRVCTAQLMCQRQAPCNAESYCRRSWSCVRGRISRTSAELHRKSIKNLRLVAALSTETMGNDVQCGAVHRSHYFLVAGVLLGSSQSVHRVQCDDVLVFSSQRLRREAQERVEATLPSAVRPSMSPPLYSTHLAM